MPNIKTVSFLHCDGLPQFNKKKNTPPPGNKWLNELRIIYPSVNGLDERSCSSAETILSANLGSGSW
jgi:hypothetical protein